MIRAWRSRLARRLHAAAYRIAPKQAPGPRWVPRAFVAMYVTASKRRAAEPMPSVWELAADYWDLLTDEARP